MKTFALALALALSASTAGAATYTYDEASQGDLPADGIYVGSLDAIGDSVRVTGFLTSNSDLDRALIDVSIRGLRFEISRWLGSRRVTAQLYFTNYLDGEWGILASHYQDETGDSSYDFTVTAVDNPRVIPAPASLPLLGGALALLGFSLKGRHRQA